MNIAFIQPDELTRTFSRAYLEESAIAFSAIDCVLNGEKAVYASSELTTGRRVSGVLRELGATRPSDLRPRLGSEGYATRIWNPNVEAAMRFARTLHHSLGGNQIVITPAPFTAPGWNQPEYLSFWETLIRTRIKAVYFNDGWEYSNGCVFEFRVAIDAGLPTLDAAGRALSPNDARGLVSRAVVEMQTNSQDTETLSTHLMHLDCLDLP